ncbi:cytochrome c oxidase subunit II [Rubrolithibacter danxiaensis]|uniref:cytochrome c oxidase subunit II n=1 Tax=Rubrolithibacter danxiaensis TaxID=3390805 RepID=UPI003BF77D9D
MFLSPYIKFLCLSVFDPHTEEAWRLYGLNSYFIIASSFILIVVIALLIYTSIKFRAKPGDIEPKQIGGNKIVEAFMIGIPFLMVAFFFYLTVDIMHDIQPAVKKGNPLVVITGHQWWWQVSYPGSPVVTANEIHLPAGKKILLQLEANDVIHSWWVPAFGPKMDMLPGATNYLWVTIKNPGIYEGVCSEFCGKQHAWMRIRIIAHKPDDYEQWLKQKSEKAMIPAEQGAIKGAAIFNKESCSGCHSIRGTVAAGKTGPDLTHIASRNTLLAGAIQNNRESLRRFLSNPQKVKPGAHMPRFIYKKDTINALVEYLSALK